MIPSPQYAEHYCGQRHNPKRTCPPTPIEFGGVPATLLPACYCHGLEHDADCPRGLAIDALMRRRNQR